MAVFCPTTRNCVAAIRFNYQVISEDRSPVISKLPTLELHSPEVSFSVVERTPLGEWPRLYLSTASGRDLHRVSFAVQVLSTRDKYEVTGDVEASDWLVADFGDPAYKQLHEQESDEFSIRVSVYTTTWQPTPRRDESVAQSELGTELGRMLRSGFCSDVTVRVKDPGKSKIAAFLTNPTLRVHSPILCARSPVFAMLLTTPGTEESRSKTVTVRYSMAAVKVLLEYMYTGEVSLLQDNALEDAAADKVDVVDVLAVADYYAVEGLRCACERVLLDRLEVNNALSMLAIADRYNAAQLKRESAGVIAANLKEVRMDSKWKTFIHQRTDLVEEVMAHLAETTAAEDLSCSEAYDFTRDLSVTGNGSAVARSASSESFRKRCEDFFVSLPAQFTTFAEHYLLVDRGAISEGTRNVRQRSRPL